MKKLFCKAALVLLFATPVALKAQTGRFITTRGKEVIGPNGKPFLMKGTNLGNWLEPEGYMFKFQSVNSPRLINEAITEVIGPEEATKFWKTFQDAYITEGDIRYIRQMGMNTVRIPFDYRLFTEEDYCGQNNPNRGFELLDRVIRWCKMEKIYAILDMHCSPGGQTGDNIDDGYGYPFLFKSPGMRALTAKIWRRIAAHYKNETTVLGYDLLNEPIATYYDASEFNPYLEPTYKQITKAIRTVDKNHIIILGGAQWDSNFKPFGPPFDSKLIYQFHKYWTKTTGNEVIQDYLDFRNKYNVPIYCGETGENTDEWCEAFRKTLEANNIGWTYWPYKKLDNTRGVVTFDVPANYDKLIDYTELPRADFAAIRKAAPSEADRQAIEKALFDFIGNSKFENCHPNKGYIEALGMKP